ncbi:hypothetical protein [Hyphomicrobium sp. CS1GBMeth3]|uniref:hypothetical protein n=1 Tax=Hyphomicrobium sp. CS1GBMeth3 TaxID=1892845 RepID=UPI000931B507|nr:hypothetical protein [Hyphomicrobium sp. CS1GBMeth3]
MLSPFELVIYGFWVLVLLPITVVSLFAGPKQAEKTVFADYYKAQPLLSLVGGLFLLTLCARAIAKLAAHFGAVSPQRAAEIIDWINAPFLVLLLAVIVLWSWAALKVRRARRAAKGDPT